MTSSNIEAVRSANLRKKKKARMEYTVREMRKEEYGLLSSFLYEAVFVPDGAEPPPKSILNCPELQVYISDFGADKNDRALAAEANGKIVGVIWARIMKDYGHIEEDTPSLAMSVLKEYRGMGIGTALLKRMMREEKACGYAKLSLSVQKDNYAVKLYRKAGFVTVSETDEEYIMAADLSRNVVETDNEIRFLQSDGSNSDFVELCHELDIFLNKLVGGEENRAEYIPYNQLADIHDVILAYDHNIPIGCAAFRKYNIECAEVKRVFLKPDYRGRGISKKLMAKLENAAKTKGYRYLILESGEPLVAAMALYKKIGYKIIPNYAPYTDMPASICMKKKL